MDWLTDLLKGESKVGEYSLITIIVLAFVKYGDKVVTFILSSLGTQGERRFSQRRENETLTKQVVVMNSALLLVSNAYSNLATMVRDDAELMEGHLEKHGCIDDMTRYLLATHKRVPTLDELQDEQEKITAEWPNPFWTAPAPELRKPDAPQE